MELARELAVRLLDLVVGRGLRDAEHLVRVARGHRLVFSSRHHDHARRPEHDVAEPVAALHDLHDVPGSTPSAGWRQQRLVDVRVERPVGRDLLEALGREHAGERVPVMRTPSTTFASSWCSAASSARSRSSSTGRSFATSRSPARGEDLLCSRATRLR